MSMMSKMNCKTLLQDKIALAQKSATLICSKSKSSEILSLLLSLSKQSNRYFLCFFSFFFFFDFFPPSLFLFPHHFSSYYTQITLALWNQCSVLLCWWHFQKICTRSHWHTDCFCWWMERIINYYHRWIDGQSWKKGFTSFWRDWYDYCKCPLHYCIRCWCPRKKKVLWSSMIINIFSLISN